MGTKTNPGKYDCYAKAEADEPLFVLLARDPLAAILVRLWADLSRESVSVQKVEEAFDVSLAMDAWRKKEKREVMSYQRSYQRRITEP